MATSAFEDNSVFGLGMELANTTGRQNLKHYVEKHIGEMEAELQEMLKLWIADFNSAKQT